MLIPPNDTARESTAPRSKARGGDWTVSLSAKGKYKAAIAIIVTYARRMQCSLSAKKRSFALCSTLLHGEAVGVKEKYLRVTAKQGNLQRSRQVVTLEGGH